MQQMTRFFLVLALAASLPSVARAAGPLAVQDPQAAARALLEAGQAKDAATKLAPAKDAVPGLYGEALVATKAVDEAVAVYEQALSAKGPVADAARLRLARLYAEAGRQQEAAGAYAAVLQAELFAEEPLVLDEALAYLAKAGALKGALSPALAELPAPGDPPRREAYARVLRLFAESQEGPAASAREAAIRRLYTELPETKAADDVEKLAGAEQKKALATLETALERARSLEARHENDAVLKTLARFRPGAKDTSEAACEVRYLSGRSARKMRRYRSARADLDFVAARCSEPWRKKARYMSALVASFGDASKALPVLERFLAAYPQDTLTDDVLVWKAEILEREGKLDESAAAFRVVMRDHPGGDMYDKARFGLALLLAKKGDTDGARAVLDEIARTSTGAPGLVRDQALYWRARLAVFPRFDRLVPTADEARRDEGLRALASLAAARPASFYGHLARLLAKEGAARAKVDPGPVNALLEGALVAPRTALKQDLVLSPGEALAQHAGFSQALSLLEAGFDDEAELALDRVPVKGLAEKDRLLLTLAYERARARHKSHQVMRASGYALPEGRPSADTLLLWTLSYPRAHNDAIVAAATGHELPPEILFGLAREESAFQAEVVSWAGAIGLCQLMPFTAKEEAQLNKIKLASLDEILDPALNARLGASHLSRRMRLGHPLLAIAAYNAGPGNVSKWRKALKLQPLDAFVESIPVEQTRNYVKKVTGSWVVYAALDGSVEKVEFPVELP